MYRLLRSFSVWGGVPKWKKNKRKIVLCHGDFDFLHLGHIKHFKAAKEKADYLIVSVSCKND